MAVLIPEDFFEIDDQQGEGAQSAPLLDPFVVIQQVSPNLPGQVKLLQEGKDPCPKNKGLYMYNPASGRSMTLPCRSRTCPSCGKGWAHNWQDRLGWNEFFHKDDKALTLTTAYDPGHEIFWKALFFFWRNLKNYCPMKPAKINKETGEIERPALFLKSDDAGRRRWLPLRTKKESPGGALFRLVRPLQHAVDAYFAVVEYNQKHTQPHFHFVLRGSYIPQKVIKKCWQKAQIQAKFKKIAFDVRIEKISTSVKQYFFKYITKLTKGKDELPRPENWKGRGVRYSHEFFAAPAPEVQAAVRLAEQQRRDDYSEYFALHSRTRLAGEQMLDVDKYHAEQVEFISRPWNPFEDEKRAGEAVIEFYEIQFSVHIEGTLKSYGFG